MALLLHEDTDLKNLLFSSAGRSWLLDPDMRKGADQFLLIRQPQDEEVLHTTKRVETRMGLLDNQIELTKLAILPKEEAKQKWEAIMNQVNEFEQGIRQNLEIRLLSDEKTRELIAQITRMREEVVIQLDKLKE